jgi:hypothetical protein
VVVQLARPAAVQLAISFGFRSQSSLMLLPRFSIRTLLVVATVVALASVFAGEASGGRVWALGLTTGLVSIPLALAVQAAFFALGSAFARWLGPQEIIARTSRGGVERSVVEPPPRADRPIRPASTAP